MGTREYGLSFTNRLPMGQLNFKTKASGWQSMLECGKYAEILE